MKFLSGDPWFYFWIFTAANTFLAYGGAFASWSLVLGLGLIALPFAWIIFLREKTESHKSQVPWAGSSAFPPLWFLGILWALEVGLRVFRLTTLSVWPIWDDAANSYFAIGQWEHLQWQLWYGSEAVPPLSFWAQSLFFRLVPPSLFSMWLWPALQSIACLFLGYWACRQYGSRPFSFFFLLLLSICFWPLYLGKFCIPAGLCSLWLFLCLGLLGLFVNPAKGQPSIWKAFGLGLCVGLGFYIWVITFPSILFFCLAVLGFLSKNPRRYWRELLAFFLAVLLLALPVINGIWMNFERGHIHEYLQFGNKSMGFLDQVYISLSYLTVFLWGPTDKSYFCFGPLCGGFLNPLLGAAFLLGFVECFHLRRKPVVIWGSCVFILISFRASFLPTRKWSGFA